MDFRTGGVRHHPARLLHGHLPLRLLQEGLGRRGPRVRLGLLRVQRPDGAGVGGGDTVQVTLINQLEAGGKIREKLPKAQILF